jgi:hypothetical protein
VIRAAFLALALALAATSVAAQRKYAILSAVGDRITIVTRNMSTGSNVDTNRREPMELSGPGLDNAVLLSAEDGIKAADPAAQALLLAPRTALAENAANASRDGTLEKWAAEVRGQLANLGATHVIVISKQRADARLNVGRATTGSGKLEGLGFYVDTSYQAADDYGGQGARGFLASYAYVLIRLVDLQSGKQVGEQIVMASNTAVPGADSTRAWDAWTPDRKVAALRELATKEVEASMPALLASAKLVPERK